MTTPPSRSSTGRTTLLPWHPHTSPARPRGSGPQPWPSTAVGWCRWPSPGSRWSEPSPPHRPVSGLLAHPALPRSPRRLRAAAVQHTHEHTYTSEPLLLKALSRTTLCNRDQPAAAAEYAGCLHSPAAAARRPGSARSSAGRVGPDRPAGPGGWREEGGDAGGGERSTESIKESRAMPSAAPAVPVFHGGSLMSTVVAQPLQPTGSPRRRKPSGKPGSRGSRGSTPRGKRRAGSGKQKHWERLHDLHKTDPIDKVRALCATKEMACR